MNLVAKESCACSHEQSSVLILGEFAGAAAQLQHGALLVNPFDIVGLAGAIERALTMDPAKAGGRLSRLRRNVQRQDVFGWVDQFLKAAIWLELSHFPRPEVFVPAL